MVVDHIWNRFGEVELISIVFHNKPELGALCGGSGASTVQSAPTYISSITASHPRLDVIPVLNTHLYICHTAIMNESCVFPSRM